MAMVNRTAYWAICDVAGCAWETEDADTPEVARREARRYGWLVRDGKVLCPTHRPKRRAADARRKAGRT
jgi:hypothetical protein